MDLILNPRTTMQVAKENVLQSFTDIIDIYNLQKYKYKDIETAYKILDISEEFKNSLTDEQFIKMFKEHEFTKEELLYIEYVKLTNKWRNIKGVSVREQYPIVEILLKQRITEEFGEEAIEQFKNIMKEKLKETTDSAMYRTCKNYLQIFSEKPFGETLEKDFETELEKKVESVFCDKINCGGYALKIDSCVFPFNCKDFSQTISSILNKFPFVRLLGEKKIEEDEYLVIYRENKITGHHFIRVEEDGTVKEKDGKKPPQIFEGWRTKSCKITRSHICSKKGT